MKYLIAILEQERLTEVVRGIRTRLAGTDGRQITVSDVLCHDDVDAPAPLYRGYQQLGAPLPKFKLEMILDEDEVLPVIDAISPTGTGCGTTDDRIVVLELVDSFRLVG
jgi:nitrogen regulatory protein PII